MDEVFQARVRFRVVGGLRKVFSQPKWESAHTAFDEHFSLRTGISLYRIMVGSLRKRLSEPAKLVRKATFYWTRDPENPHRIWAMIIDEDRRFRIPASEEEARSQLFDYEKAFTLLGNSLGRGRHRLAAGVEASWGRHTYIEKGVARAISPPVSLAVH